MKRARYLVRGTRGMRSVVESVAWPVLSIRDCEQRRLGLNRRQFGTALDGMRDLG